MDGIHVRDNVKTLCAVKHFSIQVMTVTSRTVTRGHDLYVVQSTVSPLSYILYGRSTHPKNAVKHRIASEGNVVSRRFKLPQ